MEAGGSTVGSQQGIEKQEEIGVFDVQRQGRGSVINRGYLLTTEGSLQVKTTQL